MIRGDVERKCGDGSRWGGVGRGSLWDRRESRGGSTAPGAEVGETKGRNVGVEDMGEWSGMTGTRKVEGSEC